MDICSAETRSFVMSRIRGRDTKPEMILRRALAAIGVRGYRLHADVPGRPDLAFGKIKLAVFVDGCFWHGCPRCAIPMPRSNRDYWLPKLALNARRDRRTNRKLRSMGWSVMHIWEHQLRGDPVASAARVARRVAERSVSARARAARRSKTR